MQAVASMLFTELGIGDLDSFTDVVRHDPHAVLTVLESSECRATAAAAAVTASPASAVVATAEVGIATEPFQMRDASSTAAFTSPAVKIVVQAGSLRAKDKSCQAKVRSKDAAVGTHAKTKTTKDAAVGTRGSMLDCGVQAETFSDLKASVMHECQTLVAPQLERAVAAAEAAERRITAQLQDERLARHANAERRARDASARW